MDDISTRLLQVRKDQGLSQADFAQKLNLSQNFVWLTEKGQRLPSDRTIADICRVFGVNEVWLRTGAEEMYTPRTREEELAAIFANVFISDDAKSRLIRAMARMPDEAFPAFIQFLEDLVKQLREEQ